MQSQSFANFQVGQVDDPSLETDGGFEFAAGMDIFSEPGVLKPALAMTPVTLGTGAAPSSLPLFMVDSATSGSTIRAYIAAGAKILESTDGSTFNLFLTNANGDNLGLGIYNTYVWYASATKLGRAPIGVAASKNDNLQTLDSDVEYHPMIQQAGTLKIGAGRYIAAVDESDNFYAQAMKVPIDYRIKTLEQYFSNLFSGIKIGAGTGASQIADASAFAWKGIILATGIALPDTPYFLGLRGMNALLSDGQNLYGFPDSGLVYIFDGARFVLHRKTYPASFTAYPGSVCQHLDIKLFSGIMTDSPGVFQMKGNVICQAFIPSTLTPGQAITADITFVKSSFDGRVYMGYYKPAANTYHIEVTSPSGFRQSGAFVRTLWHKMKTDKLKRHIGVKLNMKPLSVGGGSVAVAYRTGRTDAFTDSGVTIDSTNQDKPVIFGAQPRSREIQFKFTFTTSGSATAQLLSYDPLFQVLNIH